MSSNNDISPISFGKYLYSKRIEKGMSLDDIFEKTKIRPEMLQLIEEEKLENLPAPTFLKGFLKAYSDAIGIDNKEAIELYKLVHEPCSDENKKGISKLKKIFLSVFQIIIFLIFIAILAVFLFPDLKDKISLPLYKYNFNRQISKDRAKVSINPLDMNADFTKEPYKTSRPLHLHIKPESIEKNVKFLQKPSQEEIFKKSDNEKYSLTVKGIEKTWIKITVDDQATKEYTLNPGDKLSMEASEGYHILLGNSSGVCLILNNKTLPISGKSGEVMTISIP
ncbi:cytoskeleton protein RodZ [Candidatus Magnetomoraceae bacterium gMMP-1]